MKQHCRETIQRAIGLIEGIAWVSDDNVKDALFCATEMIINALTAEEGADDEQSAD